MAQSIRRRLWVSVLLLLAPAGAGAQSRDAVELAPFGGYRFGGGFYEIASGRAVDVDGAGSFGLVMDFPFSPDMQIEALVTHQEARFTLPPDVDPATTRWRVAVDHYQVGLGLTRFAAAGDNEVRFSLAAGGGVKLYPTRHLGVRLDGRLYGTIVDADVDALFCSPGRCIGSIDTWFVWQAEFTAGVLLRF